MDLGHLRYFYEVARLGGFTRAEQTLFVQQSAISKIVQKLETDVGSRLLVRRAAGVALTPVGARLFATCQTIFAAVEGFTASTSEAVVAAGDVRVAAASHVASHLLAPVLAALQQKHPRLVPRIVTGPSHLLERELEARRLDLGLFFKVAPSRLLERRPVATFPCQLVVKTGLARDRKTLETFIGSRELDDLTNRKFPTVAFLRKKGWDTKIRASCNGLEAHRQWVLAGLGVSIVPRFLVDEDLRDGRLEVVYPRYVFPATLELCRRKGAPPSAASLAFEAALTTQLASRV